MSDTNDTQEWTATELVADARSWAGSSKASPRLLLEALADALEASEARCAALARALERYANLDAWQHVPSPESETAWVKISGHPTPWVDAQEALAAAPTRDEEQS